MEKPDTSTEILTAARDLFSQKGYTATTTKEIAVRAGVNEVTIFRKFQSKQKLFEAVFEHFTFKPNVNVDINNYKGAPKQFLLVLGKSLYSLFQSNLSLIKIEFRNQTMLNGSILPLHRFPNELKTLMKRYFTDNQLMNQNKPMRNDEVELFAINFMCAIFGLFININILHTFDPAPDFEKCLESLVDSLLK